MGNNVCKFCKWPEFVKFTMATPSGNDRSIAYADSCKKLFFHECKSWVKLQKFIPVKYGP